MVERQYSLGYGGIRKKGLPKSMPDIGGPFRLTNDLYSVWVWGFYTPWDWTTNFSSARCGLCGLYPLVWLPCPLPQRGLTFIGPRSLRLSKWKMDQKKVEQHFKIGKILCICGLQSSFCFWRKIQTFNRFKAWVLCFLDWKCVGGSPIRQIDII